MPTKIQIKTRFIKNVSKAFDKSKGKWVVRKITYTDTKTGRLYSERQGQRMIAAYKGGYKLGDYSRPDGAIFPQVLTTLSKSLDTAIHKGLLAAQVEIMEHAEKHKKYPNLKGDTYTSTISAIFHGTRPPILMQLPGAKGKKSTGKYMLQKGTKRSGSFRVRHFDTGQYVYYPKSKVVADNPKKKGYDVAVEKLLGMYKGRKQGLGRDTHGNAMSAIVLTTGTEHAKLLESYRNLNVLSATKRVARKIVKNHIGKFLKDIKRK